MISEMNNEFSIFLIIIFMVVLIAIAVVLVLSARPDKKIKKHIRSGYVVKRRVSEKVQRMEAESMRALDFGEIKCHLIKNSANPHDVGKWVDGMKEFVKKPIYKELLEMKGNGVDGEC